MSKKKGLSSTSITVNRRAHFDYELSESIEAGMALEGWEVKSLRVGKISLKESYVGIVKGEVYLIGAHITPEASVSTAANPTRARKLLLHEKEIDKFESVIQQKGMTIVPIGMHWKRGRAKIKIAAGRGKKNIDKRQTIIKRDWEREQGRLMRYRMVPK